MSLNKNTFFILVVLVQILIPNMSYAGDWKFRARETYDQFQINNSGTEIKYSGLSNTINFWYEEPFDLSYGFAFGPVIGGAKTDEVNAPLGDKIKLFFVGSEIKYFPLNDFGLYTRGGIYYDFLQVSAGDSPDGIGLYLGAGYEFKVGKLGLSLEAGLRKAELSRNTGLEALSFALGLHFYKF